MKTKDRIIAESLRLFNEQGERMVSTNHIAAALGISPGNLYYHFRNKEAIIAALFEEMASRFETLLADGSDAALDLPRLFAFLDGLFENLWHYRFFNRNLAHVLSRDPPLALQYRAYAERMQAYMHRLLASLQSQGILLIAAEDIDPLVENAWLIGTFWLNYQETAYPEAAITEATVRSGILQLLHLFKTYLHPDAQLLYGHLIAYYTQPGSGPVHALASSA